MLCSCRYGSGHEKIWTNSTFDMQQMSDQHKSGSSKQFGIDETMKMTTSFQQTKRDTNTANNTTPTHLFPNVAVAVASIVAADDGEDILDQPAADPPKFSRQPRPAPPRSRAAA